MSKIDYKYNEDKLLKEFASYVDKTYAKHYSKRVESTIRRQNGRHHRISDEK